MESRNNPKIVSSPLFDTIRNYLKEDDNSKNHIFLFVPYIKTNSLEKLIDGTEAKIIIITSWRLEDLLSGSSELSLYPFCKEKNITLYINNRLHLKVYSQNLDNMILATANISQRGLGLIPKFNFECATFVKNLTNQDRLYFNKIIKNSVYVDDDLYQKLFEWYNKQEKSKPVSEELENSFAIKEKESFLISALPMTKDIEILVESYDKLNNEKTPSDDKEIAACIYHDLANYEIELGLSKDQFLEKLKTKFFEHPFIQKIDQFLKPSAQFGQIKEWVQNNCHDVPVPSRRELTGNVQVLFEWFEKLGDGKYFIDVPGIHSQRLTKVSQSEKEEFHDIPKMIWVGLNEEGKSINQIEKERNRKYPGDPDQEEFREKPVWHNKPDIDLFVANKLNLDPNKWGEDKSENLFYKTVANNISKLREEGKIVDWKHDIDQKLKRTGIWRLR